MTQIKVDIDGVNGIVAEQKRPIAQTRVEVVEAVFSHHLGYEVDLMSHCKTHHFSYGICPYTSETLQNTIFNDLGFLQLEEVAAHFGRSEGSSNVTSIAVDCDMDVEDVIVALANTNQLQDVYDHIQDALQPSDEMNALEAMAWAFVQWSLGWDAERGLDSTPHFNKGGVAADKGGIDGYGNKEGDLPSGEIQLKSTAWIMNTNKEDLKNDDRTFVGYHYDNRGSIRYYTLDDLHPTVDAIKEQGEVPWKTNLYTTNDPKGGPDRKWRFLWW